MQITVYGDTLCAQVTATAMAQTGHRVTWCVVEPASRDQLAHGRPLFREQGLDRLFDDQLESGRLALASGRICRRQYRMRCFWPLTPVSMGWQSNWSGASYPQLVVA